MNSSFVRCRNRLSGRPRTLWDFSCVNGLSQSYGRSYIGGWAMSSEISPVSERLRLLKAVKKGEGLRANAATPRNRETVPLGFERRSLDAAGTPTAMESAALSTVTMSPAVMAGVAHVISRAELAVQEAAHYLLRVNCRRPNEHLDSKLGEELLGPDAHAARDDDVGALPAQPLRNEARFVRRGLYLHLFHYSRTCDVEQREMLAVAEVRGEDAVGRWNGDSEIRGLWVRLHRSLLVLHMTALRSPRAGRIAAPNRHRARSGSRRRRRSASLPRTSAPARSGRRQGKALRHRAL